MSGILNRPWLGIPGHKYVSSQITVRDEIWCGWILVDVWGEGGRVSDFSECDGWVVGAGTCVCGSALCE